MEGLLFTHNLVLAIAAVFAIFALGDIVRELRRIADALEKREGEGK